MALQTASKAGFVGVAQFLLEWGRVNVNVMTDLGFTPLMMAAEAGHLSMLQMLISKGADINTRNKLNTTALMMATRAGHESAVQFLLEHNAEIDSSDDINDAKLKSASKAKHITRLPPLKVKIYPTKGWWQVKFNRSMVAWFGEIQWARSTPTTTYEAREPK